MNVSELQVGQVATFRPVGHKTNITLKVEQIKSVPCTLCGSDIFLTLTGFRARPDGSSLFGSPRLFVVKSTTQAKVVR